MLYLIITRQGINDAINEKIDEKALSCSKTKIFDIASSIQPNEIILIWEDKVSNPFPLWVVNDKHFLETLAYIDTYVKKYTPFTAFFRVVPLSTFSKERRIRRNFSNIDTDILIGIVIAEAHLQFDRAMVRENSLPIQAYLSTLSATIICAINSGYKVDQIPIIINNWEATKSLLNIEEDGNRAIEFLNFWMPVLSNLENGKKSASYIDEDDLLPKNIQNFITTYNKRGQITNTEWELLANGNNKLLKAYSGFTGTREDGIENFKRLFSIANNDKTISDIEKEVILSASLSILASGTMDYLSLALSVTDRHPLIAHWYMLFTGMHKKRQIFKTTQSIGNHIRKHLTHHNSLFSKVTSDISYTELKIALTNQISILPFITAHSTVIDVEIYALVKAKFRIKRNSNVVHNETREGVFLTNKEYYDVRNSLSKAAKALDRKSTFPKQRSLLDNI